MNWVGLGIEVWKEEDCWRAWCPHLGLPRPAVRANTRIEAIIAVQSDVTQRLRKWAESGDLDEQLSKRNVTRIFEKPKFVEVYARLGRFVFAWAVKLPEGRRKRHQ